MIYLELFLAFFKIGLFTFGGGYAMIPLVEEVALGFGLTPDQILNFIAVAESTPGPIAINMATFVGATYSGMLGGSSILGSLVATIGVVLPSFIIILLISAVLKNFLKLKGMQATLSAIHPAVVALILTTAITMLVNAIIGVEVIGVDTLSFDWRALVIFAIVAITHVVWKKIRKKAISPILLIILSGLLGMLLYSI